MVGDGGRWRALPALLCSALSAHSVCACCCLRPAGENTLQGRWRSRDTRGYIVQLHVTECGYAEHTRSVENRDRCISYMVVCIEMTLYVVGLAESVQYSTYMAMP